ncbi:DinB family protein [Paenibacillus endoradicis]|uniref:DinB family protein n=1 Tax=Paenibacillus endoradicis TaxID=2972487 RepID=UPI002159037B|nr:DinB family protein [Paenibacillus endoradicis]MCR8656645.1 DinB family protein [Paenibacillus endoradicis]
MIQKPYENEYLPLAKKYIDLFTEEDVITVLERQKELTSQLISSLTEEQGTYRYEQNKWSIKEVIGHISDVERLWNYRILRIARGDVGELSGYDRDRFVEYSGHHNIGIVNVLNDYKAVRDSSLSLINNLPDDAFVRLGMFNNHDLSVRACIYIIAGHELHHMNLIKTKYLSSY